MQCSEIIEIEKLIMSIALDGIDTNLAYCMAVPKNPKTLLESQADDEK